jgi:hypothetical protein
MALQGGHRFAVSMAEVFPHGVYAMGVEQAEDFDEKTRRRTPSKDKQNGDQLVWTVTCIDRDPDARKKEVKIKVAAPVMPVLPEEVLPGSGLRMVDFTGLTATPYVEEGKGSGRARLALSFRATGVHAQGAAQGFEPTPAPARATRQSAGSAESKVA